MNATPRRRVVYLNRFEDRSPGRVAFAVHRSRSRTRHQTLRTYRVLSQWLERREAMLAAEARRMRTDPFEDNETVSTNDTFGSDDSNGGGDEPPVGASSHSSGDKEVTGDAPDDHSERPSDEWTKGQLYELARDYELAGRSKLDKADLLDAVLDEWNQRHSS